MSDDTDDNGVDIEDVHRMTNEAMQILHNGMLRGISTMAETHRGAGVDAFGADALWYASLIMEYVNRLHVRKLGMETQTQLDLIRAAKTIAQRIFDEADVPHASTLTDEIKTIDKVIEEMVGKINTGTVGDA